MTSLMNLGASALGFPVFCRVTAGGRPCSDPPEVTWKTGKSSLSHQVGPSSSYGSAFAINWIVAGCDVKPTIAIDVKAPYILAYVLIGGAKVLSLITGREPQEESL